MPHYLTILARRSLILLIAILIASCSIQESRQLVAAAPVDLEVGEGFTNPLGYYEATPRFSWKLKPSGESDYQSAYQVQVASSPGDFESGADLWDSQRVISGNTSWINYQGQALTSRQQVLWRVRVWDEDEQISPWSDTQTFELGLLTNTDWKGHWIGHPDTALSEQPTKQVLATPQYLRKSFTISRDVQYARLYITCLLYTSPSPRDQRPNLV